MAVAARHNVNFPIMKYRRTDNQNLPASAPWVAIVRPDLLQFDRLLFALQLGLVQSAKRITDAITSAVENKISAIHSPQGRRRPLAVDQMRADVSIIVGDEFTGLLVQH